jgi:hypothetical protein
MPENADDYKFNEVPEGISRDENLEAAFRGWAYGVGLSQHQVNTLYDNWNNYVAEYQKEADSQLQAQEQRDLEELQRDWGDAFDERAEISRRGAQAVFGLDKDTLQLVEQVVGTKKFLEGFHKVGKSLTESRFITGNGSGSDTSFNGLSKEEAKYQHTQLINEINSDSKRQAEYMKGTGKDYEKIQNLNAIITGVALSQKKQVA